jgi:hypothetical protein
VVGDHLAELDHRDPELVESLEGAEEAEESGV